MSSHLRQQYEETPEATEFKRLYHKMQLQNEYFDTKTFLITSAITGEGKSTIAAYLAVTSAGIKDNKALLIDCDIRRPTVHTRFGLSREVGVANYLAGDVKYDELLQDSGTENLKIITAGRSHKSPSELFPTVYLNTLFQKVRQEFNIIIIDTPPIIPVSDLLFLSNEADGILFVVKSGVTQKRVAKRAFELLEDWQEKILAVVINNEKGVLPYYYDYRYYNYKYGNENHKNKSKDKTVVQDL